MEMPQKEKKPTNTQISFQYPNEQGPRHVGAVVGAGGAVWFTRQHPLQEGQGLFRDRGRGHVAQCRQDHHLCPRIQAVLLGDEGHEELGQLLLVFIPYSVVRVRVLACLQGNNHLQSIPGTNSRHQQHG